MLSFVMILNIKGAYLEQESLAISDFAKQIGVMCEKGILISHEKRDHGIFIKKIQCSNGDYVIESKDKNGSIVLEWETGSGTRAIIEKFSTDTTYFYQIYCSDDGIRMLQTNDWNGIRNSFKPCVYNLWPRNSARELKYDYSSFPFQRKPSLFTDNISTLVKHRYMQAVVKNNQIKGLPILEMAIQDNCALSDYILTIEKRSFMSAVEMAYNFVVNIDNANKVPSDIITSVIWSMNRKKKEIADIDDGDNIFNCIKQIVDIDKKYSSYFDKIIEYNDEKHENTFGYDGFDYKNFFKQILLLRSSTKTYSFAMVISQENQPFAIAIFIKYGRGSMECLLMDANDKTKELIRKISLIMSGNNQCKKNLVQKDNKQESSHCDAGHEKKSMFFLLRKIYIFFDYFLSLFKNR